MSYEDSDDVCCEPNKTYWQLTDCSSDDVVVIELTMALIPPAPLMPTVSKTEALTVVLVREVAGCVATTDWIPQVLAMRMEEIAALVVTNSTAEEIRVIAATMALIRLTPLMLTANNPVDEGMMR